MKRKLIDKIISEAENQDGRGVIKLIHVTTIEIAGEIKKMDLNKNNLLTSNIIQL